MKKNKLNEKVTKKLLRQIESLGWPLPDPTWNDVFRHLMEKENFYVMPIPLKDFRWEIGVVTLGKPNTKDNLMNMYCFEKGLASYDAAVRKGVEIVVKGLLDMKRMVAKARLRPDFGDFVRENEERCREAGLI